MPKPKSIQRFDMIFLASVAVYTVGFFLGFNETIAFVRTTYSEQGLDIPASTLSTVMTASFVVVVAIGLLLWWLISSKRSVVAKWIMVVCFGLGLLSTLASVPTLMANFSIASAISLLSVVVQAVAIWFLFQPDTKPWFEKDEKR